MDAALTLESAELRAVVLPGCGGALAELSLAAPGGERQSLLRPLPPPWRDPDPVDSACFPLVPWSNRISQGGFQTPAGWVALAPNRSGEALPIHGDGWLLTWQVESHAPTRAVLLLDRRRASPYAYTARLEYSLAGRRLSMKLSVTHDRDDALPYGLGFHPWFPYTPGTRLRAVAEGMWEEDSIHLPGAFVRVPEWLDFAAGKPVADRWVNNGFAGWDGRAELSWPETSASLKLACHGAAHYVLYHPPGAGFICFEPVTHPIDAFHLPPPHEGEGLAWLERGKTLELECTLTASTRGAARRE